MLLTGRAMPFLVESTDDSQVTIAPDGALKAVRSTRRMMYAPGCMSHAIVTNDIEIVVNHVWREHLSSRRHGLTLFETHSGLYFHARLPDTPYARNVHDAIVAGKIRHVCALSSWTECDDDGELLMVRRANLVALNLMAGASAHQPKTWIMLAGPAAELRIKAESDDMERRRLWVLKPSLSRADVIRLIEQHPAEKSAEELKVLEQLRAE